MYRFYGYTALLAAGLLVGAGCSRSDNRTASQGEANRDAATTTRSTGTAEVRYVSAVDAHANTDLYFGNDRLFSTERADTKPTAYKEVPAERRDFILKQAGKPDGMEIEKNSEGLSNGKHYTVVAYEDKDAKPVLKVFNDDESAPDNGKAKVRIINMVPAKDSVALYAAGHKDKLASESSLGSASSWQNVDPVSGKLWVRAGSGKDAIQAPVSISRLEAGKLYTIIVEGGPKSGEKLHVVDVVDNPTS